MTRGGNRDSRRLGPSAILAISLVVGAGCSGSSMEVEPTQTLSEPSTTTTATTVVATTTTARRTPARWFAGFVGMIESYNEEFGGPYQEHINELEYAEAKLDCVTTQPLVPEWRESVDPAPTPVLQNLSDFFFDQFAAALDACLEATTLGEWRRVNESLEEAIGVIDRITETIYG